MEGTGPPAAADDESAEQAPANRSRKRRRGRYRGDVRDDEDVDDDPGEPVRVCLLHLLSVCFFFIIIIFFYFLLR